MNALFQHALKGFRGQVIWYGIGLGAWAAIVVVLFVTMEDTLATMDYPQEILNAFGAQGVTMSDPRGYLSTEFFSLATLVAGAFIVFASTGALAGEEAGGRMEMLAALPMSRLGMFTAKAAAVVVALLGIIALTVVGWLVALPFVDLGTEIDGWKLAGATIAQVPFLLFMLSTGMLFGAIAPTRSAAAAWSGVVLIVAYLLVAFGSIADSVSWMKYISPYYYADLSGILIDGVKPWHLAVLSGLTLVVGVEAERAWEGRELASERWQFAALRGRPPMVAAAPPTSGRAARGFNWWWAVAAVVLIGLAGGGAYYGSRYATALPKTVTVDGRVDADSTTVFAPTNGIVRVLTAAKNDEVTEDHIVGWMESADGTAVPITTTKRGRITSIAIESGQFVLAGTPVLVVYDLASMHLTLTVEEADVHKIQVGDRVEVRFTNIGLTGVTQISSISPVPQPVDPTRTKQVRKYDVECPLTTRDERILVGLPVKARIFLQPTTP